MGRLKAMRGVAGLPLACANCHRPLTVHARWSTGAAIVGLLALACSAALSVHVRAAWPYGLGAAGLVAYLYFAAARAVPAVRPATRRWSQAVPWLLLVFAVLGMRWAN